MNPDEGWRNNTEATRSIAEIALRHRTIVVAGSGFSYPGYFRLSYCVSRETIRGSEKAFAEIMEELKS